MRSAPGPSKDPKAASGQDPASRERALILAALNQVDKVASTWTSQPGSNAGASGSVSPDAPTAAEASHPSLPRNAPLPGRDTFPGYDIQREIHRGGQGVVYLATQLATKRRVAIKVMHGGSTIGSTGRARFDREVQLLGQLNHPNIVKLHDSGATPDGSLFCVMDYISGRALDEVMREQRREMRQTTAGRSRSRSRDDGFQDIDTTLRFFAKICDGVNAAHLKGVIHRDIKPANVRVDQNGEPVLVDFGLAKVTAGVDSDLDPSNPMTMTGQFIGSLPWASPEQAVGSGDAIDLRSDVYSLGVMLYQMLTGGKFPYTVIGNMRDVLDNIQRVEPHRPSDVRRQINDEVETIVLKSLSKEKDRRYQSAGELARDIRHYLAGEPIEAKRDSGWYVIRKTMNRHRVAAGVAASMGIIITGSAIGMTAMWQQAEGARGIAIAERDRAQDNLDAVRDLANTFLYDFNDSIKNLRGATKAREIVLTKAMTYLEMLAAQPNPDDGLLGDLADAHDRVGDLNGEQYAANIGTTAAAMEHYQAAKEIRVGLVDRHPEDLKVRRNLAVSWKKIGDTHLKQRNFAAASEALERASELAVAAGALDEQIDILVQIADVHLTAAESSFREVEQVNAQLTEAERFLNLAVETVRQSDKPDKPKRLADLDSWLGQCSILRGRVMVAVTHDFAAGVDELSRGAAYMRSAVNKLTELSAADPTNYPLARDLWLTMYQQASAEARNAAALRREKQAELAARQAETSLVSFQSAESLALGMAEDPANLEAMRDLSVTKNELADLLRILGRRDEARTYAAESLRLRQELFRSDSVPRHRHDVAVGYYTLARVDESRAANAETPAERRALLELAATEYESSIKTFREYSEQDPSAESTIEDVQRRLSAVRAAQKSD